MVEHMKQILVQLDDRLAAALERHVPARSRGRSEFVRRAIQRALDAEIEAKMAAAYRETPDTEPIHFDPAVWEPARSVQPSRKGSAHRGRSR